MDGRNVLFCLFILLCSLSIHAEWEIEIVDSAGDVGMFCSLALNSQGNECISYHDVDNRDLRYAYKDQTGWHFEYPDTAGSTGYNTSLAITNTDVPCISYWDYQNNVLRYTEWVTLWNSETVPGTTGAGDFTSLCLSPAGYPHISYVDYTAGSTQYATRQPGGWILQTIDAVSGTTGAPTSIAWDNHGFCRIAYLRGGTGLMHAFDVTPSSFNLEKVDQSPGAGMHCSLSIGFDGYSRIAYLIAGTPNRLWYAQDGPGGWSYQMVYSGSDSVWDCSLDLREGDIPCIAYTLDQSGALAFAVQEGTQWHSEIIYQAAIRPVDISLVLDNSGRAHIAYYELIQRDLVVARELPPPPLGVELAMPSQYFTQGDPCYLAAILHNSGAPMQNIPLAILLEVSGNFWFWPSWRSTPFDYQRVDVPSPMSEQMIIPNFVWPDTGTAQASNLVFYGALLDSTMSTVLGGTTGLGIWTFGFGP